VYGTRLLRNSESADWLAGWLAVQAPGGGGAAGSWSCVRSSGGGVTELLLPPAAAVLLLLLQYEPELFPGLIYRMKDPKIVLLIFVSGKVVLTGEGGGEDSAADTRAPWACGGGCLSDASNQQ
jgi:hypothetical protein